MDINKVEIQDDKGNIYYPHTDASVVKYGESDVATQLSDMENKVGNSKTIDIFITMGQSNMGGRGEDATKAPLVPSKTAYEFRAISDPTKLYDIVEPFGVNENNINGINDGTAKTGSMISAFANKYYEQTKIQAVYISASVGSTSITQWQPNGALLKDAISRLNLCKTFLNSNGYNIRHTYMLWCQGETDGDNSMSKLQYNTLLNTMINEMLTNGVETCFLIRVGNRSDQPQLYNDIITAQTEYCKNRDNVVLISTKLVEYLDKGMMRTTFHYTQNAYNEIGTDAGKNCSAYVKTNKAPCMYDYKLPENYIPYKTRGNEKQEFLFDFANENGSLDIVTCGTLSSGLVDTTSTHGYKMLPKDIILSNINEWSLQFTIEPSQVTTSGIIFSNPKTTDTNFIYVDNANSCIRLRDKNRTSKDFNVPKATLDVKHNYCINYDGNGHGSIYVDGVLLQTIDIALSDIVISGLLGGYFRGSNYDNHFDYIGKCYYLSINNRMLQTYEMNIE